MIAPTATAGKGLNIRAQTVEPDGWSQCHAVARVQGSRRYLPKTPISCLVGVTFAERKVSSRLCDYDQFILEFGFVVLLQNCLVCVYVFVLVNVNFSYFFQFSVTSSTRGHRYKLFKLRCRL